MWDSYIREKLRKYYNELKIVEKGTWEIKPYGKTSEDYFQFLNDMQENFRAIKRPLQRQ